MTSISRYRLMMCRMARFENMSMPWLVAARDASVAIEFVGAVERMVTAANHGPRRQLHKAQGASGHARPGAGDDG